MNDNSRVAKVKRALRESRHRAPRDKFGNRCATEGCEKLCQEGSYHCPRCLQLDKYCPTFEPEKIHPRRHNVLKLSGKMKTIQMEPREIDVSNIEARVMASFAESRRHDQQRKRK